MIRAMNPVFHDKLKHIEIKHYIFFDKVQRGEVVLQYISTDEQIADILVKPLSKMKILHTKGHARAHGDNFLIEKGSDHS